MEEEKLLSGYCRCMDGSRRVWIEYRGQEILSTDCEWGNCPFQKDCEIGRSIGEIQEGKA